jgi:LuxR family maltose regulon positive regulatory protein
MSVTAPQVREGIAERGRLLSRPDLVLPKRLTIVVAPAGYGKTVLFAQWAAKQRRRRVQWLALTPACNDGDRFADHVLRALAGAGDDAGRKAKELPVRRQRPLGAALLSALPDLGATGPTTLVLDDFDALSEPAALDLCATLIEGAPAWLQFVVIGRADPALPYYREGLTDDLVELRQSDLAFTAQEAEDLLRRSPGALVRPEHVEQLVALTEGWPVGLQVAAQDLRDQPDASCVVDRLGAAHPAVARYFADHVLSGEPGATRRFLRDTSVLDRMSGALCDFVLGSRQSRRALEELERRSVFTVMTGPGATWFRYHHLFRSVLREELRNQAPSRESALLRRSAEWHREHRDFDAAIYYFAQAEAWDDVLEQVHAHSATMLAHQRSGHVVRWVGQIDPALKATRADVLILEATAMALSGLTAGLDGTLDAIDACGSLSQVERLMADLARCYGRLSQGDSAEVRATANRVLDGVTVLEPGAAPKWLGLVGSPADVTAAALIARGLAYLYEVRLADAGRDLRSVPQQSHGAWRSVASGVLALCETLRGRLGSAEDLVTRSFAVASELDVGASTLAVSRLAGALVARERDELEDGTVLLAKATETLADMQWPVLQAWIATERAQLVLAAGAPAQAMAALGEAQPPGTTGLPVLIRNRQACVAARSLLAFGDVRGARDALEPVRDSEASDVVAMRTRVAVESGDLPAARTLVRRWPDDPEPRARLERCLWSAVLHDAEGDRPSALSVMGEVVAECETERGVALFRDAGPAAIGLVRALYEVAPTAFLRQILERPVASVRPRRPKGLVMPLTEREYSVLCLLPTRLSNTEIAEHLGVSHNTVKTHLKHIYRKFDVVGRSEAISVAERLHLL